MSLFGNYNTPGRGVLKAPQEKKGIFKFFEVYGRHMWKLMELNLLYFVFCIPLRTKNHGKFECKQSHLRG